MVEDATRTALMAELGRLHERFEHRALVALAEPQVDVTVTAQQARLLSIIAIEQGRATPRGLARRLSVSLATVSGIVDRLVDHGVVRRQEDPSDRRVRRLGVTEKGSELLAGLVSGAGLMPLAVLERLELDDLRALVQAMGAIQDVVSTTPCRHAAGDPPGPTGEQPG